MKYAIHGPNGAIRRVVEVEPVQVDGFPIYTAISNVKATTIENNIDTRYFLIEGSLVTAEDYMSQKQAERLAVKMQAIVDTAGDQIRALEELVDYFGITRPVTMIDAISHIEAWQQVKIDADDVMGVAQGNVKSQKMTLIFQGLKEAGLDEATVNAVWEYMGDTGQQ